MNTIVFHPESDPNAVRDAAAILRRGGLLGIPTETVYGLGADALNEDAVSRIFLAKGRPQDNPLIIHVPDASWLESYCRDVPPAAYRLAERFWPGPLTMILPRRDIVPLQTTGGLETVGVRCPNHPVTLAIIEAAGVPIAAPSGNTSGRPSPTTAAHMIEDMDGRIDGIVDGGPCTVGVESTIIDLTVTPPRLLRPGGLPLESLRQVLGDGSYWLRPPYGFLSDRELCALGTPAICWSVDTEDWKSKDADKIVDMIYRQVSDGDIILLHDRYQNTVDAVLRAVPHLQEQGYVFVTVAELLALRGVTPEPGVTYRRAPPQEAEGG